MVGRTLLFLLFIIGVNGSCPSGGLEWKSNCYYFNASLSGFANAEEMCMQKGGHLASIHDRFTDDIIAQSAPNYFHESTVNDFWIGVNDLETTNSWEWTDGSNFGDYLNWGRGQPVNRTGYNCGIISMLNGAWAVANCFKLKPFVCAVPNGAPQTTMNPPRSTTKQMPSTTYRSSTSTSTLTSPTTTISPSFGNCSDGWVYFEQTQACYGIYENVSLNFQSAEAFCQTFGTHLVSFHTFEELQFLTLYAVNRCYAFWFGLFSNDNGTTWQWNDGTPLDYVHWEFGQPVPNNGQYCANLEANCDVGAEGFYSQDYCNRLWGVVCKKNTDN